MSKLEFSELDSLMKQTNKDFSTNDSDKNLGAAVAEREDGIEECKYNYMASMHI